MSKLKLHENALVWWLGTQLWCQPTRARTQGVTKKGPSLCNCFQRCMWLCPGQPAFGAFSRPCGWGFSLMQCLREVFPPRDWFFFKSLSHFFRKENISVFLIKSSSLMTNLKELFFSHNLSIRFLFHCQSQMLDTLCLKSSCHLHLAQWRFPMMFLWKKLKDILALIFALYARKQQCSP